MYPVLKKMESKKLIKSYWKIDDFDRPRKYYQILKNGIEELESNMDEMKLVTGIIDAILKSEN
jgi:DNA-binding PadR family transcriptional regulator